MVHNFRLPTEVWLIVFGYIDSKKQLIECRTVCKYWDPLAERAMFSGTILIPEDIMHLQDLYEHLSKKPMLGRYPKKVLFETCGDASDLVLVLPILNWILQFNCNITHISTVSDKQLHPDIISTLYTMAQQSVLKDCKLQELPTPQIYNETYCNLVCLFRDTLQCLDVDFEGLRSQSVADFMYDQIGNFKTLVNLKLRELHFNEIIDLDNLLQKLPQLQTLELRVDFISEEYVSQYNNETSDWLDGIEKNQAVKQITIISPNVETEHYEDFINYIDFKYPNLEKIEINGLIESIDLWSTLNFIRDVPNIVIDKCYPADPLMEGFSRIVNELSSTSNSVKISYQARKSGHLGINNLGEMYASKEDQSQNTDVQVVLPDETRLFTHLDILQSIGSKAISYFDIDLIDRRSWEKTADGLRWHEVQAQAGRVSSDFSIYGILAAAPQIHGLRFTDSEIIKYKEMKPGTLILNDLTSLTLSSTSAELEFLQQMSNIAPNLTTLELKSCLVLANDHHICHIIMPYTHLELLKITSKRSFLLGDYHENVDEEQYEVDFNCATLHVGVAFLHLITKNDGKKQEHYFMLLSGSPAMPLSKREYVKNARLNPTICIECKSLTRLKANMGGFVIDIAFDTETYTPIQNWDYIDNLKK